MKRKTPIEVWTSLVGEERLEEALNQPHSNRTENNGPEVVVFKGDPPLRRKKPKTTEIETEPDIKLTAKERKDRLKRLRHEAEIELKSARQDVFKFSRNALKSDEKRSVDEAALLRLGARPNRNRFINYKVLMQQKSEEKRRRETLEEDERNSKVVDNLLKSRRSKKLRKNRANPAYISSPSGNFKGGIFTVSKKMISKVKDSSK